MVEVNHVYVKPFEFLRKGDGLLEFSMQKDGIPTQLFQRWHEDVPTVPIYLSPALLPGKRLALGQETIRTINLQGSYPHCKKILDRLLKGITFAFDLSRQELEIIVRATDGIPSVEESRSTLEKLLRTPIETQIMVPGEIGDAFQRRTVLKASCYHPDKLLFDSPELYERMLTWLVAPGVSKMVHEIPGARIRTIARSLGEWMRQFLPDSSVGAFNVVKGAPVRKVCAYDPKSSSMWIYKGDIDGKHCSSSLASLRCTPLTLTPLHCVATLLRG